MSVQPLHCTGGPTKGHSVEACKSRTYLSIALREPAGLSCDRLRIVKRGGAYACNRNIRQRALYSWPAEREPYGKRWLMHLSCACNHYNALFGRVGVPSPPVTANMGSALALAEELARAVGRTSTLSYSSIVANYSGQKARRYANAQIELERRGDLLYKRDARVKMFVKQELVEISQSKPDPECRAIQFRSFEYTLFLAARIRETEHKLYALRDVPGFGVGRHFAKNMNDEQCGAALREHFDALGNGFCYGLDISRFDARVTPETQAIEHRILNRCNPSAGLAQALKWQLENHGKFSLPTNVGWHVCHYKVKGGRMSGDANTAFGNTAIVACVLVDFCRKLGRRFSFINNGDDSVLFISGPQIGMDLFRPHFESYGMVVKLDFCTQVFEHIEFCQSRPVNVDGKWVMVRNPARVMSRLGRTNLRLSRAQFLRYFRTSCLGELSRLRGVPVLQRWLATRIEQCTRALQELGEKVKLDLRAINESYRLSSHMPGDWTHGRVKPVSQAARVSYELAWGTTISAQLSLECGFLEEPQSLTSDCHEELPGPSLLGRWEPCWKHGDHTRVSG